MAYAVHRGMMRLRRWSLQRLKHPELAIVAENQYSDVLQKALEMKGINELFLLCFEDLEFLIGLEDEETAIGSEGTSDIEES